MSIEEDIREVVLKFEPFELFKTQSVFDKISSTNSNGVSVKNIHNVLKQLQSEKLIEKTPNASYRRILFSLSDIERFIETFRFSDVSVESSTDHLTLKISGNHDVRVFVNVNNVDALEISDLLSRNIIDIMGSQISLNNTLE